jgi:hypothetical protein
MVERTEMSGGIDEFVGFARKIEMIDGNFGKQIHIEIEPEDKALIKEGKTGRFHEFIRLTPKTTETSVPTGSVLDLYLREVEDVFRDAKKETNVLQALKHILDKKCLYKKRKLGRKFEGKEAADHWIIARQV